jgi:hypothetical protein
MLVIIPSNVLHPRTPGPPYCLMMGMIKQEYDYESDFIRVSVASY